MTYSKQLHLFHSPAQLLPDGITQLRIVEQKHLRMVKESYKQQQGFGLIMLDHESRENAIGTRAEIIDFCTLDGGILGLTLKGVECFKIMTLKSENDDLEVAEVEYLPNWQANRIHFPLIKKLDELHICNY